MIHRVRLAEDIADVPPPTFAQAATTPVETPDRILADARAQAEALRHDAQLELNETRQQIMRTLNSLHEIVQSLERERSAYLKGASSDLVELILVAAGQLVQGEISARPERVLDVILPVLDDLADRPGLRLRLHPEDAALVRKHNTGTALTLPDLIADATLKRGDCIAESDAGAIDARLDTRLQSLRESLEGRP